MGIQGINTALTALYASQKQIDTTGNNIANANTAGYTRQRVDTVPIGNSSTGFWSQSTIDTGAGVSVEDVKRIRDEFLEKQSISENAKQGTADRTATTYSSIESAFGEPGDTGIQSQMADFFASWDDVANDPVSGSSNMVGVAQTMTLGFQRVSTALDSINTNATTTLKTDVSTINSIAKDIANLNKSIQTLSNTSGNVNNLLDQRDQLVRQLSTIVNVGTSVSDSGSMSVTIAGASLVNGITAHSLDVDDTTQPTVLRWNDGDADVHTGNAASTTGGDIGGLLNTINNIIPGYKAKLDSAASDLITKVNAQHSSGFDMYGNAGAPFFTGTTAATINVNAAIVADPKKVALASTNVGGTGDTSNAQKMANLAEGTTSPLATYKAVVTTLGTESQRATRGQSIQTEVTNSADSARESVSGVNIDEEMTNLIQYQHSYAAAAKYLSTLNEVLDSLLSIIR